MYNWENKRLLIVEDTDVINFYFKTALRQTKAKITWAHDGVQAVNSCKNDNPFDLIFMDIMLPEMDGITAIERIREFDKDTPIIAQTAYLRNNIRTKCLEAGANYFMSKPIQLKSLLETLGRYLSD